MFLIRNHTHKSKAQISEFFYSLTSAVLLGKWLHQVKITWQHTVMELE